MLQRRSRVGHRVAVRCSARSPGRPGRPGGVARHAERRRHSPGRATHRRPLGATRAPLERQRRAAAVEDRRRSRSHRAVGMEDPLRYRLARRGPCCVRVPASWSFVCGATPRHGGGSMARYGRRAPCLESRCPAGAGVRSQAAVRCVPGGDSDVDPVDPWSVFRRRRQPRAPVACVKGAIPPPPSDGAEVFGRTSRPRLVSASRSEEVTWHGARSLLYESEADVLAGAELLGWIEAHPCLARQFHR